MSWTILRATLQQRRTALAWYIGSLVAYSWMMVWFYPKIGGGEYAQLIDSMPPEVMQIMGGGDISFASLGGFFQTEYLGLMWMLIVASAVLIFTSRAFAGEIADGTMELVLSQPVSRVKLAITRVVALVAYVLLLAAATFVPIQVFGPTYDINLSAKVFWLLMALGTLFMLAVGGIGMLASSAFRSGGKASSIAAGVLVVMWVSDLISNFSEVADFFGPVNLISEWQPGKIINDGTAPGEVWWLYGIVAVVSLVACVFVFSRRDVA
jgi:ABC-2 type transport system permease protein